MVKKDFLNQNEKKWYEKSWPWMTRYDLADSWVLVKHVCCDVLSKIAVRKSINVMRISSLFFFSKQWQDKKLSWDSRLNSGTSSQTLRFLKIDRLNHTSNFRSTGSFCLKYDKCTINVFWLSLISTRVHLFWKKGVHWSSLSNTNQVRKSHDHPVKRRGNIKWQ